MPLNVFLSFGGTRGGVVSLGAMDEGVRGTGTVNVGVTEEPVTI